MNFGFHPIVSAAVVGAVLALVVGVFIFRSRKAIIRMGLIWVAAILFIPAGLLMVALNPGLTDSRFRTYQAFYRDIEVGMARQQVMALARHHYPVGGARGFPKVMEDTPTSLGFFMDPEVGPEPNCEGIFLTMKDDKVAKIHYSRD